MARRTGLVADPRRPFGRGAAATLEFAFSGALLIGVVMFLLDLGFILYAQVALDLAVARAARLLAVDSTQARSASVTSFQTVTFCPLLAAFLPCGPASIALAPVQDYRSGSLAGSGPLPFNSGQGGSLMLLQVSYQLPSFVFLLPTGGSATFGSNVLTAPYPYLNEY